MRRNLKNGLMGAASVMLIMVGMGSSCPGTGSTANFQNPALSAAVPASASTGRFWSDAMIVDNGAIDPTSGGLDHNQNTVSDGAGVIPSAFPGAVFHDTDGDFYALYSRLSAIPTGGGVSQLWSSHQVDISSAGWVGDSTIFSRLDQIVNNPVAANPGGPIPTTSAKKAQAPLVTVDSWGNATTVWDGTKVPGSGTGSSVRHIFAARHVYGNTAWNAADEISDPANKWDVGNPDGGVLSLAVDHDSFNNVVAAWVVADAAPAPGVSPAPFPPPPGQNISAYYNMYRTNIGWRFFNNASTGTTNPWVPWNDATNSFPVVDLGVALGFDSYGNGYGVYVAFDSTGATPGNRIMAARWRGDQPDNFPLQNSPGAASFYQMLSSPHVDTVYGRPAIIVNPDGSATAFWYQGFVDQLAGGFPPTANEMQIWYAEADPTSSSALGNWHVPATANSTGYRFDAQIFGVHHGAFMNQTYPAPQDLPIVTAHDGNFAAVGFIKTDGLCRRFVVFTNSAPHFSNSLGPADLGGPGHDVEWGNMAVNARGDVYVVYSATDPADAREHIYANVYSNGNWQGVTQIDFNQFLDPLPRINAAYPMVSVDEQGTACAVFTINDTFGYATSPSSRRRVAASIYR